MEAKHIAITNDHADMGSGSLSELDIPKHVQMILAKPPAPKNEQIKHAWCLNGRSRNMVIKTEDPFTCHRRSAFQSTDCIRGKVGYEKGVHIFEITWPTDQYGTHAAVGVGTETAPVKCQGYRSLLGSNEYSWGWDLKSRLAQHVSYNQSERAYPRNAASFTMPDKFLVVLNMDEDYLGFIVNGQFLGPAFRGLRGQKLYLMVSAVWGHCEVTMKYIGSMHVVASLWEFSCSVIKQHIISEKENIDCQIERLNLPRTLKDDLKYNQTLRRIPKKQI